jgi:hypothetical protein
MFKGLCSSKGNEEMRVDILLREKFYTGMNEWVAEWTNREETKTERSKRQDERERTKKKDIHLDRYKTASVRESCLFTEVYLSVYKIFISSAIKYQNNFVVYVQ